MQSLTGINIILSQTPMCKILIVHTYTGFVHIQGPAQQVFSETGLFTTICGRTDIYFFHVILGPPPHIILYTISKHVIS